MKKKLYPLILLVIVSASSFAQTVLFSDNFDSYSTSEKLAEQATGSEWTTWSGNPGSSEDAAISAAQAFSSPNSAKIVTNNDLVLNLGEKTSGRYQIKFQLFVESNKGAFFGFMQDFNAGNAEFGLSVYFNLDTGNVTAGGNEFQFDFPFDTWMHINVIIDLDDDFATMFIDGNEIASWVWSLGSDGTGDLSKLDGIDFWGYSDENGCSYYIDDLEYNQLTGLDSPTNLTAILSGDDITLSWDAPATGTPTGYGIIRNNKSIDQTSGTTYSDNDLYPKDYTYTVRAIYGDQGYSAPTNEANETVAGGVARKNVLFEVVTGTWCQYCPGAAMGIHDLQENNLNFAAVKYHGGDDYEFAEGRNRITYYGVTSYPTSKIDGFLTISGGSNTTSLYSAYKPLYDQRIDIPSTHDIDIQITKTDATHYHAAITVTEEYAYFESDLVLIASLTESNISDSWQNQTEVNFASRALYPGADGTVLDFSSSSSQVIEFDIILDATWIPENCELVAFVQHNPTKEVTQAVKTEITAPSVSISVANESTDVELDQSIVYKFSDPIRHLNNDTILYPDTMIVFKQNDQNGDDVTFVASINDKYDEITINHDQLNENTTYYLQMSPFIENFYDMQVEEDLTVTFTTLTIPSPTASFSIADNATDISRDVIPKITLSEPIRLLDNSEITDPASLIIFKETDNNGADVGFSSIINDDKNLITITPNDVLKPNQLYYLAIKGNAENYYDKALTETSISFTTIVVNGIDDFIKKYNLKSYPVPSSDYLNLEFNLNDRADIKVEIFNPAGQRIRTEEYGNMAVGNQKIVIETSNLDNGVYFVRLNINNESVTQKIQILK